LNLKSAVLPLYVDSICDGAINCVNLNQSF
jgi:hypothetical protein